MQATFLDSMGHDISIVETANGCQAIYQNQQIGIAKLKSEKNPAPGTGESKRIWLLEYIEVDEGYRKLGIATEMYFRLKSWFHPLSIPNLPDKLEEASGWSEEALGWLYRLNRKGLLLKRWPTEHDTVKRLRRNRSVFEP
jgi:hypothetical protein